MKTKFRWNAMQVTLTNIFIWTLILGMMSRFNWVYYSLVTVLLVGCIGVYWRLYLQDRSNSECRSCEADLLLANDSNVRKWRCLLWISLGIAFISFVFTWIWVSDVVVISIIECQSTILILICSVVLDNRIRKLKDRALQAEK